MSLPSIEEIAELRNRLQEAEETLRAIRSGEVDALVVTGDGGDQIFTLEGADLSYRTLIEAMQQGAVSLSADGTILYCNSCFATMMATPQEKIVGQTVKNFLPDSHRGVFAGMLQRGRTRSSQAELLFRTAQGGLLPVYVAVAPLPLAGTMALCMVVTDLTEQKRHQGLQESSRRKDEFLAMLAHELRNPLAPIRSGLDVLAMNQTGENETIELMRGQVNHLVRLVDDLLDVSRIVRGRVELRRADIELAVLVRQSVDAVRSLLDDRKQTLRISLPADAIWLNADDVRLVQVIENLLNNASKYTDDEGVITLSVERQYQQAVVRVTDTGIGIEQELLPQVFDLFTQSTRSLDRSQGGLGIGLTLVKNLVEMHGGTVQAYSAGIGHGSEFSIRLPIVSPPKTITKVPTCDLPTAGRRILVVDDNVGATKILARLIERLGPHQIETAHDGLTAISTAEEFQPDLILLDIGLPRMDGLEVVGKLRENVTFDATLVVAVTGYGQDEDRQKSGEAGFDLHLVKPVGVDSLRQILRHPKLLCKDNP